ncbi:hypothetical protein N7497_011555 [Penicillium chrysogenum]|nr:hypothetical protein N7497_011555 [Penicillium chrysogenum]
MPTPDSHVSYPRLEALPYLVRRSYLPLSEILLSCGLPHSPSRSARWRPPSGRPIHPAGTRVGMAIYHIHYNETLFENPRVFDPERWLQGPEVTAERAKFLVPFSRGSRSCLGINLAYMEMYMAIAYIVRRFDLDLVGTTEEDMKWDDMVVPQFHGEFMALTKRRED